MTTPTDSITAQLPPKPKSGRGAGWLRLVVGALKFWLYERDRVFEQMRHLERQLKRTVECAEMRTRAHQEHIDHLVARLDRLETTSSAIRLRLRELLNRKPQWHPTQSGGNFIVSHPRAWWER